MADEQVVEQGAAAGQQGAVEAKQPEAKQPTMAEQLATSQQAQKEQEGQVEAGKPQGDIPSDGKPEGSEDKGSEKPKLDSDNLAQTGDAVLDASIEMMQRKTGLNSADAEKILSRAFEEGDASLIDVAYIKERFGEDAGYIEQLAKAYIQHTQTQVNQVIKEVYEVAGGEENWNLYNQTFQQHADEDLKDTVATLSDAGKFAKAARMIVKFAQESGMVPVHGQHIQGGGAVANGALSAKGFSEELAKLRQTYRGKSLESGTAAAQYQTLLNRRNAGRMQGI